MNEILGILGGMGTDASNLLCQKISHFTQTSSDQDHLEYFLYNCSKTPDRTQAILNGTQQEITSLITDACKKLQTMGATYLALPCNTSHSFFPQIQKNLSIPLLNMVEETAKEVISLSPKKVAILATEGTIHTRLYHTPLEKANIPILELPCYIQSMVTDLIYNEIKQGKTKKPVNRQVFRVIEEHLLNQEVDLIILACTELSVFRELHELTPSLYLDAIDILAKECIRRGGAEIYEPEVNYFSLYF